MSDKISISRRKFLKTTGITAGLAAIGGSLLTFDNAQAQEHKEHSMAPAAEGKMIPKARMFFTNSLDFSTLSAVSERIFPKDETGPGAIELSVPFFIDNQLASAYGYNAREYIAGPHFEGAPTQGYQTALNRRDLITQGLAALNRQSNAGFGKNFPDLEAAQQDVILKRCEKGEIATDGFTSSYFFSVLRSMVLAGVYADPMYAGNAGMNGWKMKQYPGARMMYTDIIESDKFESIDPISLSDMI